MTISWQLKSLPIRHKLLFSYSAAFVLALTLSSTVMYQVVRRTIEANIEAELTNSTAALLNMVRTAVSVSIKNHLRAVAEKNLEIVEYFYHQYRQGVLNEADARNKAEAVLLSQKIGRTGYIACVSSTGTMLIHPEKIWIGKDISSQAFVQQMITRKEGYIEYEWQNPGDDRPRPKALYCTYFEPWDWIINASSYRREFSQLVNVEDFRDGVLDMRFGRTGYSFILSQTGRLIVHPTLQGLSIQENPEILEHPVRTMLAQKRGKLIYNWRNPGEDAPRTKLVIFNDLPGFEWILASSSYIDEFYTPLETISRVIIFTAMACWLVLLPITFWISRTITLPLQELIGRLDRAAQGDFSGRVRQDGADEVGQLSAYFNTFMDRLQAYSRSLESEIAERKEAEAALRISEENYRSVMEAAPDPIIVYDMQGRVDYLNPAFTQVYGWTPDECLGQRLDRFVPADTWETVRQGLSRLMQGQRLTPVETRRYTKDGRQIEVSISGAVYRNREDHLIGCVTIHRDISELRRLEKEVMDIGDQERQNIGHDLHDDLAPHLIGIEGLCAVLSRKLGALSAPETDLANNIKHLIQEAITKTRRLARGLCPVYLVDHGLEASLNELAANTGAVFGIQCRFRCDAEAPVRDNVTATHVFRIAQEALHNAVRHGRARSIEMALTRAEGSVRLTVADDGSGMPAEVDGSGMGLRIMGFRARIIGATLEIDAGAAGGCRVVLTLPCPNFDKGTYRT